MTDDRDICERLEDPSYDGAIFMRQEAAKNIRAYRHYIAELEYNLAKAEIKAEQLQEMLEKISEIDPDSGWKDIFAARKIKKLAQKAIGNQGKSDGQRRD